MLKTQHLETVQIQDHNCTRHQDQFVRTANSFHVKADDKYTGSLECVVFMITGVIIPTIDEMTTDEYGLRSMKGIDPMDLRIHWMSARQLDKQGPMPSGKELDHVSMYGTDLSD